MNALFLKKKILNSILEKKFQEVELFPTYF